MVQAPRSSAPHSSEKLHPARKPPRRLLRDNGLSIVMLSLFVVFWIGQIVMGFFVYNDDRTTMGEPAITFAQYFCSAHFVEATAENWESEFLQMFCYIALTACLFQRGSAESNDPDAPAPRPSEKIPRDAPWPVRRGGLAARLYAHSLSLAFLTFFAVAFVLHAMGGARLHNEELQRHGEPSLPMSAYMRTPQFWFESFQNWQSEFLAVGSMVVLSIFLREKNSPESKRLETPFYAHD